MRGWVVGVLAALVLGLGGGAQASASDRDLARRIGKISDRALRASLKKLAALSLGKVAAARAPLIELLLQRGAPADKLRPLARSLANVLSQQCHRMRNARDWLQRHRKTLARQPRQVAPVEKILALLKVLSKHDTRCNPRGGATRRTEDGSGQ